VRALQRIGVLLALCCMGLMACGGPTTTPSPPTAMPPQPTATAALEPSPEPESPRQELIICSVEPRAASPFETSTAGGDLLALFYEGSVERVGYAWEPRLLERLPSLESGDAMTRTVIVAQGSRYADASGAVFVYTGTAPLMMPQLVVTFTLQSNLRWSDGEPLTAQDALLGYHLAQEPEATGRWAELAARTQRFEALNVRTLRWEGIPGYLTADFVSFGFPPQPSHRWRGLRLEEVLADREPVGTGPFMITAWERGREVRFVPNPYYVGTPPKLASLVVRFPQASMAAWPQLLVSGECDVVLPDPAMKIDWQRWATLATQGQVVLWADVSPTFLRLDFNIAPPEGKRSLAAERDVRQALAHCIDRARLTSALAGSALLPAQSFLPPGYPGATAVNPPYNPTAGQALLEAAGWRDEDGNGFREAHGVPGIAEGTPLSLSLHLSPWYMVAAAHISADAETCGIRLTPQPADALYLYAPNPEGPLAGRAFDLVLFGWGGEPVALCGSWRSDRIPGAANDWEGENFSGFASPVYDAACERALNALTLDEQRAALGEAQAALALELPTLFLTWRPYWFVARPEVLGLQPDSSAAGALWNAEALELRGP